MELLDSGNEKKTLDVLDAIYGRRAVRSFSSRPVSISQVEELINAAIHAPSAMNQQPWAFVVIQNRLPLNSISVDAKEFLRKSRAWRSASEHSFSPLSDPSFDIFYGASTLIVLLARKAGFEPVGDCYLAGENIMLAAHGLGLATCPIGFARDVLAGRTYRAAFNIPDDYSPILPIAVGYPTEKNLAKPPRYPPRIMKWVMPSRGPGADERESVS